MAATKNPWKPLFAICDGRPFSGRTCRLGWSYEGPPELHTGLCPAVLPSKCNALPNPGWCRGHPAPTSPSAPPGRGWPVGRCCRKFREASLLSNPLLPKSLLVRGAVGGRWGAVCCHCGNGISSGRINLRNLGKHGFSVLFCNSNPCCQVRL